MSNGTVESIWITPTPGTPTNPAHAVEAVAGSGLRGDRHFDSIDAKLGRHDPADEATLIEIEAIEAAKAEYAVDMTPALSRRNIMTRGVALNHLVGREFTVGGARMRGIKLCEPCGHMEKLSGQKNACRALIHRGGLRAQIIQSGTIHIGDAVQYT